MEKVSQFNCFALLALTPTFEVNMVELTRKYHNMMRASHPDLEGLPAADSAATILHIDDADKWDTEQADLNLPAQINHAYRVLSDPILRATHLLELAQQQRDQTDSVNAQLTKPLELPVSFLEEQFALQQTVQDCAQSDDYIKLQLCLDDVSLGKQQKIIFLQAAFREQNFYKVRELLAQLHFYVRTISELERHLERAPYLYKE